MTKIELYGVVLEDVKSQRKYLIPDILRGKAAQLQNTD